MIAYFGPGVFTDKDSLVEYMQETLRDVKLVAVDVESFSIENLTPVGISIAPNPREAFYFTMYPELEDALPWQLLDNPLVKKIFHNALFDLSVLDEFEPDATNIADTTIICHLLNLPAALVNFADVLDMEIHHMGEYLGKGETVADLDSGLVAKKCCQDSKATYALYDYLLPQLDNVEYFETEMQLIPILVSMSMQGLKIDHEVREALEIQLESDVEYYRYLCDEEGFNPASPQQVGFILAKRGNRLPIRRRKNSRGEWQMKLSTREEDLEKLIDPLAGVVLNFRHASKALSTYIRPYAGKARAYTRWHMDAMTGRISSTRRNLQNIPPDLRQMFVPDNHVFTSWDASQIELRCLAYMSQDEEMLRIFETGGDIHQATADFMRIERRPAKNVNFAMIYGATDETIMETAHIQNIGRARELKDRWFDLYRDAGRWILVQQERGLADGYIETMYGRRIAMPVEQESQAAVMRKAVNYPIQGSAAEIIKRAMLKCKHLPMVLQIHDELVADGNHLLEVDSLDLENTAPFYTPFDIKLMERWQ